MKKSLIWVFVIMLMLCLTACMGDLLPTPVWYTLTVEIEGEGLVTPVRGRLFNKGQL